MKEGFKKEIIQLIDDKIENRIREHCRLHDDISRDFRRLYEYLGIYLDYIPAESARFEFKKSKMSPIKKEGK